MWNTTLKELNSPGKNNIGRLKSINHTPVWSSMFNSDLLFFRPVFKKRLLIYNTKV